MSEAEYSLDNYRPAYWPYVVREGGTKAVTDGTTETVITLSHAVWADATLVSTFVGRPVADLAHQFEAEDWSEGENIVRGQPVMSAAMPEALDHSAGADPGKHEQSGALHPNAAAGPGTVSRLATGGTHAQHHVGPHPKTNQPTRSKATTMTTPQEIVNELVLQTVTGTVTWEISSPFWLSKHDGATFFVNHGDGSSDVRGRHPDNPMNRLADADENWPLYDLLMETHPPQTLTDRTGAGSTP